MSFDQTEDLKAFEKRLTEVISQLQPITVKWRIVLIITAISTVVGAFYWLTDTETYKVSFLDSLSNHMVFAISSLIFFFLFIIGIHRRVIAPSIIANRSRLVLADYNMSCDDTGKLILKPRPGT